MPLIPGSQLSPTTKDEVLRRFINRYTGDFKPEWVRMANKWGCEYICYFDTDEDWLNSSCFHVKEDGSLDDRYVRCETNHPVDPQQTMRPMSRVPS
jgi:hypothetical protein